MYSLAKSPRFSASIASLYFHSREETYIALIYGIIARAKRARPCIVGNFVFPSISWQPMNVSLSRLTSHVKLLLRRTRVPTSCRFHERRVSRQRYAYARKNLRKYSNASRTRFTSMTGGFYILDSTIVVDNIRIDGIRSKLL